MQFYRKHRKLIKISSFVAIGSSIGWIVLEIKKTHAILNNALDTSVIDFVEPLRQVVEDGNEKNLAVERWLQNYHISQSFINRIKNAFLFSYARRLQNLAASESRAFRTKAIKQLAKINNLHSWHYTLLAHMCDAKTAVGLARTKDVDPRFFTEPPFRYISYNHDMFVNTVKDFLVGLHNKSKHVCIGYFLSRVFVDVQDVGRFVDQDSALMELSKFIQNADNTLTMCLESILHHSAIEKYAKDIVELNGLPLLMEIHNRFKNNKLVSLSLCKILANISIHAESLEEIFRSGWIGVLAEWVRSNDVRLSATAAKTLANLDCDDNHNCIYSQNLFTLYPYLRDEGHQFVDVVFIHGLLGGVFYTWRQRIQSEEESPLGLLDSLTLPAEDTCDSSTMLMNSSDPIVRQYMANIEEQKQAEWEEIGSGFEVVWSDIPVNTNDEAKGPYSCPRKDCTNEVLEKCDSFTQCWPRDWLPKDCPHLRVIGISYDTNLSMWAPLCPDDHEKATIEERSNEFLSKLVKIGLGKRPIIWVCHSMGGLIVKNMLLKAHESNSEEIRNMFTNTKSLVFYSTPHFGSKIANINPPIALVLWPSIEVQELREDASHLIDMHQKFLGMIKKSGIKVVSFVETKSTLVTALKFNYVFVERRSANPGVGEFFEIPQDHLCICKPLNRHSFLYQKLLHIVKEVIEENRQR